MIPKALVSSCCQLVICKWWNTLHIQLENGGINPKQLAEIIVMKKWGLYVSVNVTMISAAIYFYITYWSTFLLYDLSNSSVQFVLVENASHNMI